MRILSAGVVVIAAWSILPETAFGQAAGEKDVRPHPTEGSVIQRSSSMLRELQRKIRTVRTSAIEKRNSELARLKAITTEKRALSRKLEALRSQLEKREAELAEKSEKLEKTAAERKELEATAAQLVSSVAGFLDRVDEQIEESIPWTVEARKKSVADARKTTVVTPAGEMPSPASAMMAAARVQQEEEALGRLVESGTETVEVGGEERQVFAFHLGLLGIVFANEEGSVIGFVQAGESLDDGVGAASAHADAAEGYLVAVDILRRRRTPGIVELWLPRLAVRKEGE